MTTKRVYFSFHYQDIWRAQVVRNSGAAESFSIAGFSDAAEWEQVAKQGELSIQQWIDRRIQETSITVVLIGPHTAKRRFVDYEIRKTTELGRPLLGIRIHMLKDAYGQTSSPGTVPEGLIIANAPIHDWQYGRLVEWIETAIRHQEKR